MLQKDDLGVPPWVGAVPGLLLTASLVQAQAPVVAWDKSFGSLGTMRRVAIAALPDGGSVVAAGTNACPSGQSRVMRLESAGNTVWSRVYGGGFRGDTLKRNRRHPSSVVVVDQQRPG